MNQFLEQPDKPAVCFVHDWLVTMRGGEKVLEAMSELFPEAPIYTLFTKRENLSPALQGRKIYPSFLQYIPGISRFYRWLLPLFPLAIRSLNVKKYDLVISSSHCVAKAIRTRKGAVHICYCHTPMRYLWGFSEEYFGELPNLFRWLIELYFRALRKWDMETSQKVSAFIANSKNTAEKIRRLYGKEAAVIYPPVETPAPDFPQSPDQNGSYFLIVSALVPYKRIDIAIEAFNQLRLPLKIVGDGPLRSQLEKMARCKGIEFEGAVDQKTLWNRYANCRALIFPGEEDFGIVPVEAQLFGKPVIAFGKGGATETILPYNKTAFADGFQAQKQYTGVFFSEQTPSALIKAISYSGQLKFDPAFIRGHAQEFGRKYFQEALRHFLNNLKDLNKNYERQI